jgi:hypothetical protein
MVKAVLPCLHLAPAAFGFEGAGGIANDDSEIILEASVGAQLCRAAALVFTRLKVELFRGVLSASKSPPRKNQYLELQWSKLTIDRAHANEDGIPGVFHQFVKLAQALPHAEFRKQEAGPLDEGQARTFKVDFVGENAADNGGPYRELFNEVVSELESDALDLLLPAPNRALGGSLPNQDKWVVNPACKKMDSFKWLGKLLGIALRCDVTLALNLPDTVWKRLVGRPVTFADVRAVDAGAGALASLQVVLSALCSLLTALCSLLSALCSLLSALCSLLSALCSLLSAFCSLPSALCLLLSALCSLLSALCSLLSALCSLLSALCFAYFYWLLFNRSWLRRRPCSRKARWMKERFKYCSQSWVQTPAECAWGMA